MNLNLLKGKTAIVTGGTRGIGFSIVRLFLENNAKVALLGSRSETVHKALSELKAINPSYDIMGLFPDLADFDAVSRAFEEINARFGKIDILVNNAGISAKDSLYDYNPEDFDKIMDLNVKAVFNCSKAAAPYMKKEHGGSIINTSSMVSINGQPSGCGYPASKYAVNGLTKSLARELGKDNIRVNAVAPGITRTDMVAALPEAVIQPMAARIPLGRIGEPDEIANVFLFLASDLSAYVSGALIEADGAMVC